MTHDQQKQIDAIREKFNKESESLRVNAHPVSSYYVRIEWRNADIDTLLTALDDANRRADEAEQLRDEMLAAMKGVDRTQRATADEIEKGAESATAAAIATWLRERADQYESDDLSDAAAAIKNSEWKARE